MSSSFCIGIDLGTSNSAIAQSHSLDEESQIIPIPQMTAAGAVTELNVLPSALYFPIEGEAGDAGALPWPTEAQGTVGAWARERGSLVPDRLVASAKSWLCNPS